MISSLSNFNQNLFFQIYHMSGQNPVIDNLMIFGADYLILIILLVSLALTFRKNVKYKKALLLTVLSIGLVFIILKIFSQTLYEPRPFKTFPIKPLISFVPEASFPSTHLIVLSVMTISYAYYRSRFTILLLASLIWTGFARIFVGVHYPMDIFSGIIFGVLVTSFCCYLPKFSRK